MPQLLGCATDKEAADVKREVVGWIRVKYAGIKMDKAYTKHPVGLRDAFETVIMKRYRDKYEWAKDKKKIKSALCVWFEDGKQRYKKQTLVKTEPEDPSASIQDPVTDASNPAIDTPTNENSDYSSAGNESDEAERMKIGKEADAESYLDALNQAGVQADGRHQGSGSGEDESDVGKSEDEEEKPIITRTQTIPTAS